jgi:hypothetical protein
MFLFDPRIFSEIEVHTTDKDTSTTTNLIELLRAVAALAHWKLLKMQNVKQKLLNENFLNSLKL